MKRSWVPSPMMPFESWATTRNIDMSPDGLEALIEIGLDAEPAGALHKGDHKRGGEHPHSTAADVASEEFRSDYLLLVAFNS